MSAGAAAVAVSVLAGVVAGTLGLGGGALFVPVLVIFADLSHLDAEATSLLAIVPVALVGAWRQNEYGNMRMREGVIVGLVALPGAMAGVALANVLPERAVELGFAAVLVLIALQFGVRGLRAGGRGDDAEAG